MDLTEKKYIIIVQCHIVKERCPGYLCEKALTERSGGFANYPKDTSYRMISLDCGGCCGRALQRKLSLFARTIKKKEAIEKDQCVVHLSSCITKDNFHAPPCPHLDYLRTLIQRVGLECVDDTVISPTSEKRRQQGLYHLTPNT
jgi:predicted metal-binding protein